jgi:periplasmic protein CpxP/Spy
MKRIGIVAVLAIVLGALPLVAYGRGQGQGGAGGRGPGGGQWGPGGPPGIMQMVRHLDLTDAQREQLRVLMDEARKAGDPGEQVRTAEQKLHVAVLADPPDPQAIEGLKTTLNTAHAAELDHRVEMMQKVAQILTPAQKQQLLTMQPQGPRGRGPGRR